MKFSKEKMANRLINNGMFKMVDHEAIEIMIDLNGQEVQPYCWKNIVMDENVGWCIGKSGQGHYVNLDDCE